MIQKPLECPWIRDGSRRRLPRYPRAHSIRMLSDYAGRRASGSRLVGTASTTPGENMPTCPRTLTLLTNYDSTVAMA